MSMALTALGASLLGMAAGAAPAATGDSALLGAWRITSQTTTLTDASGQTTTHRREPVGHIVLTPGRIMVMVVEPDRKPATDDTGKLALFDSLIAYTGRITVDAEKYIVTLDYTSNMLGVGDKQVRYYELDGDDLTIRTAPGPSMIQPGKTAVTILTCVREK